LPSCGTLCAARRQANDVHLATALTNALAGALVHVLRLLAPKLTCCLPLRGEDGGAELAEFQGACRCGPRAHNMAQAIACFELACRASLPAPPLQQQRCMRRGTVGAAACRVGPAGRVSCNYKRKIVSSAHLLISTSRQSAPAATRTGVRRRAKC
jgi:hypothetical protein